MSNILNISVSGFASYQSTEPKEVNLLTWLTSDKYADKVNAIRSTSDKPERDKLKAMLPAITPSGIFSKREAAGLKHHSGFIQIDVDNVPDIAITKAKITSIENVAYCGLSVSGHGLWALIPISQPEHHREYFTLIEKALAGLDITIDTACKDVSRLRGYSYDKDAYFNHSAIPLHKWFEPKKQRVPISHFQPIYGNGNADKVNVCLNQIQMQGLDLTGTYQQWFEIGCSLANEFGEGGRSYYHSVSQFHPKHNPAETDKQFNHCLRHRYSTTIATFFAACKDAGVTFKENYTGIKPIFESSHQSEFNRYGFSGGIGTIPVIPVEKKAVPDVPKWLSDAITLTHKCKIGELSEDSYIDYLMSVCKYNDLTIDEYVSRVNEYEF